MKFLKDIMLLAVITVGLSACGESSADVAPTPTPGIPTQDMATEPPTDNSDIEIPDDIQLPDSGFEFTLTAEEKALYDKMVEERNTDIFEGVSPISVAKVYIELGCTGEWEAEFAMIAPDTLEITKEEFEEGHFYMLEEFGLNVRRQRANWFFPFIDEAEIVMVDDNTCTLDFVEAYEYLSQLDEGNDDRASMEKVSFYLVRNDKGIWEVRYNPI